MALDNGKLYDDELFLGNDLLSRSETVVSLDITSSQNTLRGEPLAQKKILEGKVTLDPASNLLYSLTRSQLPSSDGYMVPDPAKWDFYLVTIPFTVEMPSGSSNFYKEVTFYIELTTPGAVAFDLFPRSIVTEGKERDRYGLYPDYKIRELDDTQEHIGKPIRFDLLPPKITAFGEGKNSFYWLYEGLAQGSQNRVQPGVKKVLIVLQVPHGTQAVDGDISYETVISKRLLGAWQDTQAATNAYPIYWQLTDATQFSSPTAARMIATKVATPGGNVTVTVDTAVTAPEDDKMPFDVCIVCAMAEELEAFIEVVEQKCNVHFADAHSSRTNRQYKHATIKNKQGETLRLHASCQTSNGPLEASLHLRPVLEEFQPRFVAMTGICAGDKSKVKLGDIIVAERSFLYDTGKFVLDENGQTVHAYDTDTWRSPNPDVLHMLRLFSDWKNEVMNLPRPPSKHQQRDWLLAKLLDPQTPRIDTIPLEERNKNAPLWRDIVRELQTGAEPFLTKERKLRDPEQVRELDYEVGGFPYHDPAQPAARIAPIASGSAVRADRPFADVQVPVRGTLAIDMEGAAFYRTVGEFALMRSLLVKGVSDYADPDKDDTYHAYAAQVSALYMLSFIQQFVTSERMPSTKHSSAGQKNHEARAEAPSHPSLTSPQPSEYAKNLASQEEADAPDAIRVVFSYAQRDETLARELEKHLVLLKRQGLITNWLSHKVMAGQEPENEARQQLQRAQIILLLISQDFLFSDRNYTEMNDAVELQKSQHVAVIPVLLRAADNLDLTPIGKLQMLPRNGKPIQQWHDRDAAFAEVAREIRAVVDRIIKDR